MPPLPSFRLSRSAILALWVAALPLLLAGLGTPVTQRTQEARVLETAREMLEAPDWHQWLIPRLNEKVRLEKPPFAYWMAAGGFKLFGVNEFAGRLPFAVAGWLLLAVVYRFGRKLIDEQFGFFSTAILLTTWMFASHFRLAETDAPATLFLTAAVYWLWKGADETRSAASFAFFQLAGLAIGLAALPKGPQAGFAILFFVVWVIVERKGAALSRLLLSGALLMALVIGGWWYLYIGHYSANQGAVLWKELAVVARGSDHIGHFYNYFPWILRATVPWAGLVVVGSVWGFTGIVTALMGRYALRNRALRRMGRRWRREPALRVVTIWAAAVLVPLLFAGNKQNHYLVPMMPPLAMLAAFALCRGLAPGSKDAPLVRGVIGITFALSLLSPAAIFFIGRYQHQPFGATELAIIVICIAALAATVSIARRHGAIAGVACYAAGMAMVSAVLFGRWMPSLNLAQHRDIAAQLRADYGERPFVYYGKEFSLPLIWNLRQTLPLFETSDALNLKLDQAPQTVVITQTKNNREPPAIPERLRKDADYEVGDEGAIFRVYVVKP